MPVKRWDEETGKVTDEEVQKALTVLLRSAVFNENNVAVQRFRNAGTKINDKLTDVAVYVVVNQAAVAAFDKVFDLMQADSTTPTSSTTTQEGE